MGASWPLDDATSPRSVAASIAYEFLSVVKYIVPAITRGPACSADTSGSA